MPACWIKAERVSLDWRIPAKQAQRQKATVPRAPIADDQLMIFCKKGETVFISRSLLAIGTSKRIILISTIASFAIFVSFEAIGAKKYER